jgi:hypothetical protein
MKKVFIMVAVGIFVFALSALASAQEQQAGQALTFDKGEVTEHPSDLHLGSDPQQKKAPQKYEGSDDSGYKRDYDPSMQYYEETTTYKQVKGKKGKASTSEPEVKPEVNPTRYENTQ